MTLIIHTVRKFRDICSFVAKGSSVIRVSILPIGSLNCGQLIICLN